MMKIVIPYIYYLIWGSLSPLPVGKLIQFLLMVLLAANQVLGHAMAMEVMVARCLDENITGDKTMEAYHTLTARQVALRQELADYLQFCK